MYKTCPKCGYRRAPQDTAPEDQCPACGLLFSKWLKALVADAAQPAALGRSEAGGSLASHLEDFFLPPPRADLGWLEWSGYAGLLAVFALWGWYFIGLEVASNEIGGSFMHNINLVFHEAGHMLFIPFGRFMTILGGSLFQVLMPLGLMLAFLLVNRDGMGAALCLWWTGQSLMDLAPYIADARALRLPLLGGGTGADTPGSHYWANILRQLGLLQQDQVIANSVDLAGSGVVLLALVWGAILLLRYYRSLKRGNKL
ncbi:MAG: hypothetical protein RLZZ385_1508 [Pseudomonadota bacterium]|jgi:hypothetical protein